MTSPSRMFSRAHSHLDDLDLQPVREVKERVLNDVPHNPAAPSSRVKFNFVDVSFPKQSKISDKSESVHDNLEKIAITSKRKRSDHDNSDQKENRRIARESKVLDKENKFFKMAQSHSRITEDDRHAFLSKILKRGIPVWEEVPEEERSTKCISGTNPFRNQPQPSNPSTANITLRNSNMNQKTNKMPIPVWEDVQNGSMNSYSLSQGEDFVGSSVNNVEGNEERLQVHENGIKKNSKCSQQNNKIQVAQFKPDLKSQHSRSYQHQSQVQSQVKMQNIDHQNYQRETVSEQTVSPREQTRQECNFSPDQHLEQIHISSKCSSHQDNIYLQDSSEAHSQESKSSEEISQTTPIEEMHQEHIKQERLSRPVMKRKHGGPIEDNHAMECISWWPGEKLLREKNKNGKEEKHEKEPTKEAGCKRDLSALSRSSTEPPRRRHKMTDTEVSEKGLKTPPHVKNYEQAEVRKYMQVKRSERHKIRKEQQFQLEQEKIKREERLKELAVRTKQLAQTYKKTERTGLLLPVEKNKDQIQSKTTPNWNCPEGCEHGVHFEKHLTEKLLLNNKVVKTKQKTENYSKADEDISRLDILETQNHTSHNCIDKAGITREIAIKKRRKKDSKRKNKQKSVSDSESISDIVSRTVEECERHFKSSSLSLDNSSLSSVSHNSSDIESQSSETLSAVTSLEMAPKQRIISLSQMAQRLSSRITEEEENLKQQLLNERRKLPINTSLSQTLQPIDSGNEISKCTIGSDNIKDIGRDRSTSRVPLSYSEIEALSVEELIAKMKSMLPDTSPTQRRSNVADNTSHISSKSHKKEILRKTSYDHEESKGGRLSQKQDQSEISRKLESSNKDLPKLIPPDIPALKLSGDDNIRIVTEMGPSYNAVEDLSSLPGYNVEQYIIDEQAQKRHPHKLPMQKSKDCFIPSPFHFRKLNQLDQCATPYVSAKEDKMEKAALLIQSTYRGYRVRKITSVLLKKCRSVFLKKNIIQQTKSLQNNTEGATLSHHKFFKSSYYSKKVGDLDKEAPSEEQDKEIDWQGIKTELENRTFTLGKDSQYIFQRSDLPEWIKPYFLLSETGNVQSFVENKVRELEAQNLNTINERKDILTDHRAERHEKSSRIKNISCLGKTQLDVTLTEGPLSDLEEAQDFSSYEKETQTNFTNDKNFLTRNRNISKEKKSSHKQDLINEEKLEFIELRKKITGKKILALPASDVDVECDISQKETVSEAITLGTDLNSKAGNASDSLPSQEHGKHEETLEEGLLEETEQNLMQESGNHVIEASGTSRLPNFEEQHTVGSSSVLDSSSLSESVKVEKVTAPHKLLGRGPHFGPASLRLRLNAELMYQDSVGEALNQLHNMEQLDILTRSQQEAFALSQSLVLQQQKRESEAQQKIEDEKQKKEEDKNTKKVQEKKVKEEFKKQNEVLWSVEKMEREARDRFTQLEREVRARAEQVLSNATKKNPESSNNQSDVIAAAAVAAVGATISQWERLRPVQKVSNLVASNEGLISASITHSQHYTSSITGSSSVKSRSRESYCQKSSLSSNNEAANSKKYLPCSEKLSVLSESNLKSCISEELSSTDHSAINSSVEEQLDSEIESDRISISENILTGKSSNRSVISERSTINHSHLTMDEDVSSTNMSLLPEDVKSGRSKEIESLKFVSEAVSTLKPPRSKERSQRKDVIKSKFESSEEISECLPVLDAIGENKLESNSIRLSSGTVNSEAIPLSKVEEFAPTISSSSASVNSIKQACVSQNNSTPNDLKTFQNRQSSNSQNKNIQTSSNIDSTFSSKLKKTTRREENETPDTYSESFEIETGSDGSSTSSTSQLQGKNQRDMTLVVSSGNILNQLSYRTASQVGNGLTGTITDGGSALGMTLNLVESLQKEEEVRLKHQEALLKLQEQSLIEEARWKLAALQSEGGVGLRKRQRAVLLQLREQRAHLKRLIETQNIAAQQRRLMLLQHHHLLATTTNMVGTSSRGHFNNLRGCSPSPGSPQLTPRMMEMGVTSSSDAQDDVSPHLSVKGRDTGSSSPSDGGGQEKRRSHSEERKKIASVRIQEKRRAAENEALLQQFLHEDREILRLKSKSPHESYEKDFVKSKRKGDYMNKRLRDKRNKSPTSASSQSIHVLSSKTSAESSVLEESIDASVHDNQSSVPEGGSESISQSDLTSSVSEQEGSTYRSCHMVTSVPFEISGSKKSTFDEEISGERQINSLQSSSPKTVADVEESSSVIMQVMDSRIIDKNSSINILSSSEKSVPSYGCQSGIRISSNDKTSKGAEKSSTIKSDIVETISESVKAPIGMNPSSVGSDTFTQSRSELVPEVIGHLKIRSNTGSKSGSEFVSGSEASSSNTKSEVRSFSHKASSGKALPLPLRVPLSPRSPHRQHRRYSSESDDSFTLSQTETASDISDGEGKLLALKEQLASRRAEAERLKKEKRRLRRERLASQERALRQQISTYDSYIQQAKMELEKESKELQQAVMVKPVIKKPQVAETKKSKLCESVATSPEKSDVSDLSLVSEDSKSGQYLIKSQIIKAEGSNSSKSNSVELVLESQLSQPGSAIEKEFDIISSFKKELNSCKEEYPSEKKTSRSDIIPQEEAESLKTLQRLSISEEYSFESETISEHSIESFMKKSLSQDSNFDTDHTPSQASSTETIVLSPQKVDSSQKDGDDTNSAEISSLLPQKDSIDQDGDTEGSKSSEVKLPENSNLPQLYIEDERKLEIFLPAPDAKSHEVDEFTEQNTSAEESIEEEIAEDIFEEIADEKERLEAPEVDNSSHHTSEDSKLEEEIDSSNSLHHYTDKEASPKPESPIHTNTNFAGYPVKESHSQCISADERTSQQHESPSHISDSLSSFPQQVSQSLCHIADKEVSLKYGSSQCASDNLPFFPLKLDCAEHLNNEDRDKNTHSLDRQRLVDDISNNLLSSMMKDTTQLFRDILKDKDYISRKGQSYIIDDKPSAILSETSQPLEDIEQDDISKTTQLHQEVTEPSRLIEGLESLKDVELKDIKELDDISKSSNLSKLQILKRVGELIGEDGSSCSPSQSSSRPLDFQLTPQMTFDLSPNILSPISSTPASPSKVLEDIEMEQLPETVYVSVSAETDAAIIPGASFPSEISKENSEDQAVSPSHDISKANDYSLDLMALTNKLLNLATSSDLDLDDKLDQLGADNTEFSVEGIEGNWFDDDFWASADNRKKQLQLKAEEERIAAEIAQLEELQHLQEKYPDLVIREVPNKPPPPYTPPPSLSSSASPTRPPAYGSLQNDHVFSKLDHTSSADTASATHRLSKADQRKLAAESFCVVPSYQEEVMYIINDAFTHLYEAWKRGIDPSTVEPPYKHLVSSTSNSLKEENSKQDEEASIGIFHLLLFCLTRELVSKAYQLRHAPLPPPWVKQPCPPTRMLLIVHTKSKANLLSHVQEQSNVLFGWKPALEKESLMVRWARKHRDLVDQILVKELHAEESSWTHYDEDEAAVKTQVANEILDTLIAETITLIMSILARKITHVVQ